MTKQLHTPGGSWGDWIIFESDSAAPPLGRDQESGAMDVKKTQKGAKQKSGRKTSDRLASFFFTTTWFQEKAHFFDSKIKSSEKLIFFLFDVFLRRVKWISYESFFWWSYGAWSVKFVKFRSICRVWGKISVIWRRNQQHGYITSQSTWVELYNGVLTSIKRPLLHVARLLRIPDILFIQSQKSQKKSDPRGIRSHEVLIWWPI